MSSHNWHRPYAYERVVCIMALLVGFACATLANPAQAVALDPPELKEADAAVLLDKGGNVLYSLNPEKEELPASTTKVMTAIVALESGHKLDETVSMTVPEFEGPSQMVGYTSEDKISLGELIRVMLVYSGNDAAYNVAVHCGGSEEAFVKKMNEKAADLGLVHTHFMNPHGLEQDDHYTCALDLARIGKYAMEKHPFIAQAVANRTVDTSIGSDVITLRTTDFLLDTFDGMRGIKTGWVADVFTFVGASGRGDVQLYSSVLGCPTESGRYNETATLMEWGYSNYVGREAGKPGWVVGLRPYAFNFGLRTVLRTAGDGSVLAWPESYGLSYSSAVCKPNRLLDTSKPYGRIELKQKESDLGGLSYVTDATPKRAPALPVFSLPLFGEA